MKESAFEWWRQPSVQDELFGRAAHYRKINARGAKTFVCVMCGHLHLREDEMLEVEFPVCWWCGTMRDDDPGI